MKVSTILFTKKHWVFSSFHQKFTLYNWHLSGFSENHWQLRQNICTWITMPEVSQTIDLLAKLFSYCSLCVRPPGMAGSAGLTLARLGWLWRWRVLSTFSFSLTRATTGLGVKVRSFELIQFPVFQSYSEFSLDATQFRHRRQGKIERDAENTNKI